MAKQSKTTNAATELEAAVLGVVWRDGPCTRYAIRQDFRESRAPRWSGSAGAIYPLVQRLELRGLVRSKSTVRGKRPQRDYRITPRGRSVFERWLRAPFGPAEAALLHDPLRTWVLFLDALPLDEARSLVSGAIEVLGQEVLRSKEDFREHANDKSPLSRLAARNALLLSQARIRWLVEVKEALQP